MEKILHDLYGELACFLNHSNPFQLLVATILSAQCTDKKVNNVTPALFECYPDPAALADAEQHKVVSKIPNPMFFRIFTHEKNLDLLFMILVAIARSGATDERGGSRRMLFNTIKGE